MLDERQSADRVSRSEKDIKQTAHESLAAAAHDIIFEQNNLEDLLHKLAATDLQCPANTSALIGSSNA